MRAPTFTVRDAGTLASFIARWRGWTNGLRLLAMDGRRPRPRFRVALEVDALPDDFDDLDWLRGRFPGWRIEPYGEHKVWLTPPATEGRE